MAGTHDDALAYGDYDPDSDVDEYERGLFGDVYQRFKRQSEHSQFENQSASQHSQDPQSLADMSKIFDKLHHTVHRLGEELKDKVVLGDEEVHGHTHPSGECTDGTHAGHDHRFLSFAPQRDGNDIKWYVDACGYMWAVSRALETARESIWILDWWLSPELYLRRPPARYEQYRIDRMLKAAADRGVKVNIIVYKEVTQALTRKFLNPTLPNYLHSLLPQSTDRLTLALTRLGLDVIFKSLEEVEATDPLIAPPITVSSSHTKHHLEDLSPNICVFRHPDHLPDRQVLQSSFLSSLKDLNLTAAAASKLSTDALKSLYGTTGDTVLYWAHHEKLCLVDGRIAFMGGLDLCYGRWDTNQHAIADAHPGNLDRIVFPGQDYNNARIMDFQDVTHWQNNKLDRTKSSRMGWSDVSICMSGPVVQDLQNHFVQRWNFIYDEKYRVRPDPRYSRLPETVGTTGEYASHSEYGQQPEPYSGGYAGQSQAQYYPPPQQSYYRDVGEEESGERGFGDDFDREGERGFLGHHHGPDGGLRDRVRDRLDGGVQRLGERYVAHQRIHHGRYDQPQVQEPYIERPRGGVACQMTRSCAKWSHGVKIEHSIANAYMEVIKNSQHFVYIENQFFVTATSDKQRPIKNKIGAAIVERILRAARNGEKYKMIVNIPAIPAFAGDLKSDDALSTRAIMEFQYNSINRGGYSIMESIAREGYDPTEYIRFYNLRNYDRINISGAMAEAEQISGVSYEDARKQHDDVYGGGFGGDGSSYNQNTGYGQPQAYGQYQGYGQSGDYDATAGYDPNAGYGERPQYSGNDPYYRYQQAAAQVGAHHGLGSGRWDTVSGCYMLGGEDIRNVPWEGGKADEMDAFVSEELYIHSKLLIADDRVVICGSANLNDRSQLGDHDSEIAVVVEDPTPVDSYMNGQPWRATKFAASLRRQLFRKHLGLLKPQDMQRPDTNFEPVGVPNEYDWGSREDVAVADPLSDEFLNFWNMRAKVNTDAFARVFHPVPYDGVRNWKQYDDFYERFFHEDDKDKEHKKPSLYKWGHVVAEDFSPGEQGVREVKEILSTIKGTLVEMPLLFLKDEDIAKEGLGLNAFTEEVYT